MNISKKLPACFAACSLAVACAGLFGLSELNHSVSVYKETVISYSHAQQVETIVSTFKTQVQEWKNTLLRGKDAESRAKYWQAFQESEKKVITSIAELKAKLVRKDELTLLEQFAQAHTKMGEDYRKGYAEFEASGYDSAIGDKAVKGKDRAPTELLVETRIKVIESAQASARIAAIDSERSTKISLLAMLIGFASAAVGGVFVTRSIVRPLSEAVTVAKSVSAGDLRGHIQVNTTDETGQLLAALHEMNTNLTNIVTNVRDGAQSIAVAAGQIAQGNLDLSNRTEHQASSLEETAASTAELASTVKKNTENVEQANKLAISATDLAEKGGTEINKAVSMMASINESAKQMSDIIGVIDSIAFQTNILALNAAVEAARAGEQGRGFAVVASEVRALAQRSASAAKDIKALITDSIERVETGSVQVNNAGDTMLSIISSVKSVMVLINEISAATKEQAGGVAQINTVVNEIDMVTQQNAALVEEAAAAAESLREQTEALNRAVDVFKIN